MCEIIFRGKKIETNEWVHGYYNCIKCNKESFISFWGKENKKDEHDGYHIHIVEEKTLGQYTGFKDSKNKNIYEGDIVKINNFMGTKTLAVEREDGEWLPLSRYCKKIFGFSLESCLVIGNKYDNPELLTKLNKLKFSVI